MMGCIPPDDMAAVSAAYGAMYSKLAYPQPYKPKKLIKRERMGVEEVLWEKGTTRETVYHEYDDGTLYSIARYKTEKYTRITVYKLAADGSYAELKHLFMSEVKD